QDDSMFLMGQSLSRLSVTDVAERLGDLLTAIIYLTAFMLPPGMPAIAMIQHEKVTGEVTALDKVSTSVEV
ncbi:MAG: hypothetical protein WED82_00180, partial [Balneolales bacterium]